MLEKKTNPTKEVIGVGLHDLDLATQNPRPSSSAAAAAAPAYPPRPPQPEGQPSFLRDLLRRAVPTFPTGPSDYIQAQAPGALPNMSPSSNGDSPLSATGTMTQSAGANIVRHFPLPNRDFTIEIPSPQLVASTNGLNSLKSPTSVKSARTPSFSREGILGSAQKARDLSQSSENRPEQVSNGVQKPPSDEGSNPLKRRNTDAGVDYPRRRATIAVG